MKKVLEIVLGFSLVFVLASGGVLWYGGFFFSKDSEILPPVHATYVSPGKVALPLRISIPKIKVDAAIEAVGVTPKNTMANPSSFKTVGWYKYGPRPGELGSAVLAGHLDNALGFSGVFKRLDELVSGDEILISTQNGTTTQLFRVTKTELLPYDLEDKLQLEAIFNAPYTSSSLHIITCAGSWVRSAQSYDKRLLIRAEFVREIAKS